MEVMQGIKSQNISGTLDYAMAVMRSKLDDAIDDVENGRVIYEEELWAEIDAIWFGRFIQNKKYKIKFAYISRDDICHMKKYILDQFKYRELGENFMLNLK